MKYLSKLIFGALLSLNINNNGVALQFDDLKIDMLQFMNDLMDSSVNNKDLTQSKVNCVFSVYAMLGTDNVLSIQQSGTTFNETVNIMKNDGNEFFKILKNNNINIKNNESLIDIADELCTIHLKNAFINNDIDKAKKILKLSLEKINQEKQKMKNNLDKTKYMSSIEKKRLFNKNVMGNLLTVPLITGNKNDLIARKKAINEFNVKGDDTIKIINNILGEALEYLKYKILYFQALAG